MRQKDMPETLRGQTNPNAIGNRDRQPSREEMYSYTHFSTPTSDSNSRSSGGFGGGGGYNGCEQGGMPVWEPFTT